MAEEKNVTNGVHTPVDSSGENDTSSHGQTQLGDGQKEVSASEYPEGGLRGWLVVAGSAAIMFCTFGYLTGFGVYQQWYGEHQLSNFTQSDISWIGSVQIFLNFSVGLISGPILDRFGNVTTLPASILYVVSLIITSFCKEFYQFFLAQSILGGICLGILFSNALAILGHYFHKRNGLASGLVMSGAALGGVIFPVALNRLLNSNGIGFGWSVRVCALIILVLLGFANLVMKTRLPPTKQTMDFSLTRRPIYILVAAGGWLLNWGLYVPLFYLPPFAISAGLDVLLAPYTVAIFNAASIFGRAFAGALADKLGCFNVMVLNGIVCAITLFVWPATHTVAGVIVGTIFQGLFIGSVVSLQAAVIARITPDPQYIGSMVGITMAIWACGGLTGPPIAGAIFGMNGSYDGPAYFGAASLIAGSAIFFVARLMTERRLFAKV